MLFTSQRAFMSATSFYPRENCPWKQLGMLRTGEQKQEWICLRSYSMLATVTTRFLDLHCAYLAP